MIRSKNIGRVYITGAGRFLRTLFRRAHKEVDGLWFVVGMHGGSTIGEQYFCCELDKLPKVLKAIAADSPEFTRMLLRCAGSGQSVVLPDTDSAVDRGQNAETFFDSPDTTII
jgi:hypothetical protein